MTQSLRLAFGLIVVAGCKQSVPEVVAASPAAIFELDCHSSNTATAAELFCIRTDTRSGEIERVNHLNLPTSNGPTAVNQPKRAGQFTTVCDATSTNTRSDLYCVRLDTETGDMLLVNLQKIASVPKQ